MWWQVRFLNSEEPYTTGSDLQLYKDNKMDQEGGMQTGKQQMPRFERNLLGVYHTEYNVNHQKQSLVDYFRLVSRNFRPKMSLI